MASPIDVNRNLKEALISILSSVLSQDTAVRETAEQELGHLEVTDEYGVHLAELILDTNSPVSLRQIASVILRQYIEHHWTPQVEKFHHPETTPEAKEMIKRLLLMALSEPESKIRLSVAYAIATIAHWDWPESWENLVNLLIVKLKSGDNNAVHGAMRVLCEVSRDVSDNQMPQIAPDILPEMRRIFTSENQYSIRTRGRAVQILVNCLEVIAAMSESNKRMIKELWDVELMKFTQALVGALLQIEPYSDSGLKKDVLNALKIVIKIVPKQISSLIFDILNPVWNALTQSADLYVRTVVNNAEGELNITDSDGEVLSFENLVFSIFDFVGGLVESSKFRDCVKDSMADLLYYVILYMQITESQMRIWHEDIDRFVEDEDDESYAYSVRISSQDLLMALGQEFEDETAECLTKAVERHMQQCKLGTTSYSWKIHESCMFALGSAKDLIITQMKKDNLKFDILGFLETVMNDLLSDSAPLLSGRCLLVASKFAEVMTEDMITKFLECTARGLEHTQPSCIIVASIRAVYGFCDNLKNTERRRLLLQFLTPWVTNLLQLTRMHISEVLGLILESICMILTVDSTLTATFEHEVTPVTIDIFVKFTNDPVLVSACQEIFKELCQHQSCLVPVQNRLLPTLMAILQGNPEKNPSLQAVALDVLNTIVRSGPSPISQALISQVFPAVCFCIVNSDDTAILQNGSECLRAYVSTAAEQIAVWHDATGRNGLDYVISAIELILAPGTNESAAAFIGNLVSALVHKVGQQLGERADLLLRAVLSKLQQVESLSVCQNLILVFAQLFRSQTAKVLDFLSGVPGPIPARSALEFVLIQWCNSHSMFYGAYDNKVSAFTLSQILEYAIKTDDQRLQGISVDGDPIYSPNVGVRTRSKTANDQEQWSRVPLLVKIYKILVHELASAYESFAPCDDDDDYDESSDEDIDVQEGAAGEAMISTPALPVQDFSAGQILSRITNTESELEVGEDDPDIIVDPLYRMDMKAYLTEFLQRLAQLPCYRTFCLHHTEQEKRILSTYLHLNV